MERKIKRLDKRIVKSVKRIKMDKNA